MSTKIKATIIDPVGMHAHPASVTVKTATEFESKIQIQCKGKTGSLKSIMNVLALGVKQGDEVIITAEGKDAEEALVAIENTMKKHKLI